MATPHPTSKPTSTPIKHEAREVWMSAILGIGFAYMLSVGAWGTGLTLLALLTLPALMNIIKHRFWPFAVAVTYFGASNAELPVIITRFFDPAPSLLVPWVAPVVLTLIQSSPFLLYRPGSPPVERAVRMAAALLLLTLPGVGWVAWMNPLFVAGVLYPGMGYVGLLLALVLFSTIAGGGIRWKGGNRAIAITCAVTAAIGVAAFMVESGQPQKDGLAGWYPMDTRIEPAQLRDPYAVRKTLPGEILAQMADPALDVGAEVVVFPESVLAPMTPADHMALVPTLVKAQRSGAILLVGETLPLPDDPATGAKRWRNTVRALGAMDKTVDEARLPMPMGNWRLSGGVAARPFASDIVPLQTVSGPKRVAMSICYEDTVIWPHMGLLSWQADVMVSMSNSWATDNTRGDTAQRVSARMLARLAGVPLVQARNTWGKVE